MPLIEITPATLNYYDKEESIKNILSMLAQDYPHFHIIANIPYVIYDFLIIRTRPIIQVVKIESMNPYEKQVDTNIQEVYAVSIFDPKEDISKFDFSSTAAFTKCHIIASDEKGLKRRLNSETNN